MAATPFGPGTVLAGRFTLDDLIGDTDGARFWRATDRTLARNVAVHVIAEDDERADSLLTAARTSALVTDGHLLRVLDAAREDGVVYVVNEWGSGVSLDRLLEEGPLSPRRAAWVVKEVAEAIATAHRNGVAHGRLLPENVMITEAGSVKLIGFVVDAVLRGRAGRDQRRVTGGEPMSAHESDVVNLGGLLYAALVGRWPGSEGSTVPAAPAEHGRPLRPAAGAGGRAAPARRDLRAGAQRRQPRARGADRDRARGVRRPQRLHRRPDRAPRPTSPPRSSAPVTWPGPATTARRPRCTPGPSVPGRRHRRPAAHRRVPRAGPAREPGRHR